MLLYKVPQKRTAASSGITLCFLGLIMTAILGGCGFRPLYGQKNSATSLTAEQNLSLIEINVIQDRIGQQLHNNLLTRLNPKGRPNNPLYSLSVTVSESIASLGVKKSAEVTRGNLHVTARYSLLKYIDPTLEINTKEPEQEDTEEENKLPSGGVTATSSYDIPQAQYTAIAAAKDARTRALREIADEIRTRLAVYFQQASD